MSELDRFIIGQREAKRAVAVALRNRWRRKRLGDDTPHRVKYRNDHVAQLVRDFRADGAIYEQMKFCTYWSYERVIANQIMPRDYGIQVLSIDRPYIVGQSGQLRTRVQAFVESIEMKKLRVARKEEK